MEPIVIGLLLILLLIVIIWPPFLIFIAFIILLLGIMYYRHSNGPTPPYWVWGKDPLHEVFVKFFQQETGEVALQYRPAEEKGDSKWIRAEDDFDHDRLGPTDAIPVPTHSRHTFYIRNLSPQTRYEFQLIDLRTSEVLPSKTPYYFTTQSDEFKPFHFAVAGDAQQSEMLALLETLMWWKIKRENPAFLLYMGDHVHKFSMHHFWLGFFRIMSMMFPKIPYYPTVGNHCGGTDNGHTAGSTFLLAPFGEWNYSWQYQNVFFIALNSLPILFNDTDGITKTEAFLKEQLANKPKSASFTIVMMHVPWIGPPYSQNGKPALYEEYLEKNWKPILSDPGVDVVFSGHKHSYVRDGKFIISASIHGVRSYPETKEPDYVVRNSHHYLVVNVSETKLSIVAKGWNNAVIDTFVVEK